MYSIYADGELLFSTASTEEAHIALSPMLTLDVRDVGSLSFTLPPGNVFHGRLRKLKTIVTVMQDDVEIFRGRVTDETKDIYNQSQVYCEGDKAFFADSLYAPYTFAGTVHDFARSLVDSHNSQVSADKQFVLGELSAVPADKTLDVEDKAYRDTYSTMEEMLVSAYGGYLRTRTDGGTHYLDWLKEYGTNSQSIEFSVNLLDLKEKVDAGDVFTCLIPLGKTADGKNGTPLTIESVNGGKNYIRDEEGVALYGEIWRTQTWGHEGDPAKLLETGQTFLKTGVALETLTINAVDMHFLDGSVESIRIGDSVHILSNPHGIDKMDICSRMEIDLVNPEKTRYTFGEAPKTLTDNVAKTRKELRGGGGGGGRLSELEDELDEVYRWANYNFDEHEGRIDFSAGEINRLTEDVKQANVSIDGVNANISLVAEDVAELGAKVSSAEVKIDGANANINLLAGKSDEVEERLTTAEVNIDGLESDILLRASKSEVEGLAKRVSSAEVDIDGANANINLLAQKDDELAGKLSKAEVKIDGANANIDLVAEDVSNLDSRVTKAEVKIDGANANINILTQKNDEVEGRMTAAEVDIDGLESEISLRASKSEVTELGKRVSSAEADIDGANANINLLTQKNDEVEGRLSSAEVDIDGLQSEVLLRASKSEVNALSGRITEAEASIRVNANEIALKVSKNGVISAINQTAESVTINASKINLSGYVTASKLQSSIAELQYANSLAVETNVLNATNTYITYLKASSFTFGGELMSKRNVTMGSVSSANKVLSNGAIDLSHSHAVSISEDGTITLGEVSATGGNFKIADTKIYKDAVSAAASKVTLSASGWQPTATNTITASNGKQLTVTIPNVTVGSSSWINGSKTVNAYYGNSGVLGSTTITLPTNSNVEYKWSNPAQGYAKVEFTIGGRKYSASKNVSGYV